MKKKLIVVLVLALTCITLLTGCSKSKTYEVTFLEHGKGIAKTVQAKLSFHEKGNPENKLIFAEDGYVYVSMLDYNNQEKKYEYKGLVNGSQVWERHGDIIITNSTSIVYKLYDNGKFLTREKFDSYPSIEYYEAD